MCMLKLGGKKVNAMEISALRKKVAKEVLYAYEHGLQMGGVDMRDVIHDMGMDGNTYAKHTAKGLWASQCELHAAAKILNIGVRCITDKGMYMLGMKDNMKKMDIILSKQHWYLGRCHGAKRNGSTRHAGQRGGMNQQQGGTGHPSHMESPEVVLVNHLDHFIYINPTVLPDENDQNMVVFLDMHSYPQLVNAKIKFKGPVSIATLRDTLSRMLRCSYAQMNFFLPRDEQRSQPLPNWIPVPYVVLAVHLRRTPAAILVTLPERRVQFAIQAEPLSDDREIKGTLSAILGCERDQISMRDQDGNSWSFDGTRSRHSINVYVNRGGMRSGKGDLSQGMTQRTVSTTQTWRETEDQDDQNEEENPEDPREPAHEVEPEIQEREEQERLMRMATRSRSRSPTQRRVASPVRYGRACQENYVEEDLPILESLVWPKEIPSAQPEWEKKLAFVGNEPIAVIWAMGMSEAYAVMGDIEENLNL